MVFAGAFADPPSFVAVIIAIAPSSTPPPLQARHRQVALALLALQHGDRADRLSKIRHSRKLA
jgi:hypothetical protein